MYSEEFLLLYPQKIVLGELYTDESNTLMSSTIMMLGMSLLLQKVMFVLQNYMFQYLELLYLNLSELHLKSNLADTSIDMSYSFPLTYGSMFLECPFHSVTLSLYLPLPEISFSWRQQILKCDLTVFWLKN